VHKSKKEMGLLEASEAFNVSRSTLNCYVTKEPAFEKLHNIFTSWLFQSAFGTGIKFGPLCSKDIKMGNIAIGGRLLIIGVIMQNQNFWYKVS
jgi:hypothetical protein